jgi:hypothetical protein
MSQSPTTTIDQDAADRLELMYREATWRKIYDACAAGNGATGYAIFESALLRAFTQGATPRREL